MGEKLERVGWYLLAALVLVALYGADRRASKLEARVLDLEQKGCLMTGAHTGCKRIDR
jgi:hypothetical protein